MPDVTRIKHGPFEYDTLPGEEGLLSGTMPGYAPQFILGSDPETGLHGKLGDRFFHGLTHPELMGLLSKNTGEFPTLYKNSYGLMGAVSRLKGAPITAEEAKTAAFALAGITKISVRLGDTQPMRPAAMAVQTRAQPPVRSPSQISATGPTQLIPSRRGQTPPTSTVVEQAPRGKVTKPIHSQAAYAQTQVVGSPYKGTVPPSPSASFSVPLYGGAVTPSSYGGSPVSSPIEGVGPRSASAQLREQLKDPSWHGEMAHQTVRQGAQQFKQVAEAGPLASRAKAFLQYGANPFQSKEKMLRGIVQKRPELEAGLTHGVQTAIKHPQGMDAGMREALERYGLSTKHIQDRLGAVPQLMEEAHRRTGIPHREFIGEMAD